MLSIHAFWFGEGVLYSPSEIEKRMVFWFKGNKQTDELIRKSFSEKVENALLGKLDFWLEDSLGTLSLIILLDQFTRNLYRDTPRAFSGDSFALYASLQGIDNKIDETLSPIERVFFYLPLEHSEDIHIQNLSMNHFHELRTEVSSEYKNIIEGCYSWAEKHYEIIKEFGRFPHRNKILGRPSTKEELELLKDSPNPF